MKHILIGTAGHVDHGKTTLIQALTGINTDRLKEEKKRGITIDLGYAYLPLPNGGTVSVIDVPGHEKFIKNMLAGAGGIDFALLVIAADDGVMPQTREHLNILELSGVSDGIIVLTKNDLATDNDWREMVREDIRETVAPTFLADAPVFEVSSHTGYGIDELKNHIIEKITKTATLDTYVNDTPFRIPVDRVFSVDGFGTVVTGTLTQGTIKTGDTAQLYPTGHKVKIRRVQVHGGDTEAAFSGQRVAVNLSGIQRGGIKRGSVLATPGSIHPTRMLDVKLTVIPDSPREIKTGTRLHFYYGTANVLCKVVLLGNDRLLPGQETYAQLRFAEEVAVKPGDRFVLRFYSPVETVGGGIVLHAQPKKHRKGKTEEIKSTLKIREQAEIQGDATARILQAVNDESPNLTPLNEIKKQLGYENNPNEFDKILNDLTRSARVTPVGETHAVGYTFLTRLSATITKTLSAYHTDNPLQPGIRKEELRSRVLPVSKPPLFDDFLHMFTESRLIYVHDSRIALNGFQPAYTSVQKQIRDDILTRIKNGGFTPPTPEEMQTPWQKKTPDFLKVLDALQTEGQLITTEPGILFLSETIEKAKTVFLSLSQNTQNPTQNENPTDTQNHRAHFFPVTLAQFRDGLATSRKFALSLLEYFDRIGFTRKEGDARVLK
jgi:selenocysteine-specific elongation factor